eukprot:c15785_g1_i1.p1 GENE.c15785_g1_i1~~c15785_g1_i1.p1  ORF type:complete len:306 (-),score=110.96 c15785_g1_i1:811-1728(-)
MIDQSFQASHPANEEDEDRSLNPKQQDDQIYPEELKISLRHSTQGNIVFLSIASVVEFFSAGASCVGECNRLEEYAILVGAVSLILCFIHLFLISKSKETATSIEPFVAVFLLSWWCLGAGITTFFGPFTEIRNGFFASWAALFLAVNFAFHSVTRFQDSLVHLHQRSKTTAVQQRLIIMILISSFVEGTASSVTCFKDCTSDIAWGVSAGVISFIIALLMLLFQQKLPKILSSVNLAGFLALWWTGSAAVLTFGSTFDTAGNGYFASWICCIASLYLCFVEITSEKNANRNTSSEPTAPSSAES